MDLWNEKISLNRKRFMFGLSAILFLFAFIVAISDFSYSKICEKGEYSLDLVNNEYDQFDSFESTICSFEIFVVPYSQFEKINIDVEDREKLIKEFLADTFLKQIKLGVLISMLFFASLPLIFIMKEEYMIAISFFWLAIFSIYLSFNWGMFFFKYAFGWG